VSGSHHQKCPTHYHTSSLIVTSTELKLLDDTVQPNCSFRKNRNMENSLSINEEMALTNTSLPEGLAKQFSLPDMCEDDADMLERGVDDNSSEPATPYERPRGDSLSLILPPPLDLGESCIHEHEPVIDNIFPANIGQHLDAEKNCNEQENYKFVPNCVIKKSPSLIQTGSELSRISVRLEAELRLKKQELSEEKGVTPCNSVDSATADSSTDPASSASKVIPDELEDHAKKYHRRLQESAQFAEAVGEPQNGMIQVIIDDDDDDDSEEDEDDEEDEYGTDDNEVPENEDASIKLDPDAIEFSLFPVSEDEPELYGTRSPAAATPSVFDNSFSAMQVQLDLIYKQRDAKLKDRHESPFQIEENDCFQFVSIDEDDVEENVIDSLHLTYGECHSPANTRNVKRNDSGKFSSEQTLSESNLDKRSLSESNLDKLSKEAKEKDETLGKTQMLTRRSASYQYFRHQLPMEENECGGNYDVFKGIISPEVVTKRGITRGNFAQLHRKAWLEVSDKHHRYGKNLRTYYKYWEKLGHPTNMFFDWLDAKGEGEGWESPTLAECPREQLDGDRVLYINDVEEQSQYLLKIESQEGSCNSYEHRKGSRLSKIVDVDGNPVQTGPSGWIFVLRDNEIYGAEKRTKPKGEASRLRFHHSSFFGGKAVAAAGIIITDDNGCLTRLYPHSGHYRPGEAHMQRMLYHLYHRGVDLHSFLVDMQQIMHVSREVRDARTPKGGTGCDNAVAEANDETSVAPSIAKDKKAKKTDSLHLKDATFVALFLGHKARSIGKGLYSMIHKIRPLRRIPNSVTTILAQVDSGGVWNNKELLVANCCILSILTKLKV
jgi:hypothetical protein